MTIHSKPTTEEYRRGWERTFGSQPEPECECPEDCRAALERSVLSAATASYPNRCRKCGRTWT